MSINMIPLATKILFVIDVIFDERKYAADERELEISLDTFLKENAVTRNELQKIIDFLVREKCLSLENPYRNENIDQEMFMRKRNSTVLFPFFDKLAAKKEILLKDSLGNKGFSDMNKSDQTQRKRGRRATVKYDPVTKTFFYRNRSLELLKNAGYASLCDAFYPRCPKSGNLAWQKVQVCMCLNQGSPLHNREKLRELIRTLNRWADRHGLSPLLKLEKDTIVRLL